MFIPTIPTRPNPRRELLVVRRVVPVECYSRVVGYLRPVAQWNVAKRREFEDRLVYRVARAGEGRC